MEKLKNLQTLILSSFEIIKNLKLPNSLSYLDLSYSNVDEFNFLLSLKRLQNLKITYENPNPQIRLIENLPSLKSLSISGKQLAILNSEFLNKLVELQIDNINLEFKDDKQLLSKLSTINKPASLSLDIFTTQTITQSKKFYNYYQLIQQV